MDKDLNGLFRIGNLALPITEPGTPEQMAGLNKLSQLSHIPYSNLDTSRVRSRAKDIRQEHCI